MFLNKQQIVQTMLKWLFCTSINLDSILKTIIEAEVFESIPRAFYPVCGGHAYIYTIFKENKQLEWFIFTLNLLLH